MAPSEAEILADRLAWIKALVESLEHECDASAAAREKFEQLKREMATVTTQLQIVQSPRWSPQTKRVKCPNCLRKTGVPLRDLTVVTGKKHFYCEQCAHAWHDSGLG